MNMICFICFISLIAIGANAQEIASGGQQPADFAQWSEKAIAWGEARDGSRDWWDAANRQGYCLRFVANAFMQKYVEGQSVWNSPVEAAAEVSLFNQEAEGWLNAPRGAVILFDKEGTNNYGHVGIYQGDGKILHSHGTVQSTTVEDAIAYPDVGSYLGWIYPPEAWRPKTSSLNQPAQTTQQIQETNAAIDQDTSCLATVLMSEASIGTYEERLAVAWTIFNRVDSPNFPNTICEVVNQRGQYATNQEPTQELLDLAASLIANRGVDPTGGASYFFSPISMPKEGDDTSSYDVGGGLHDVTGIDRKVYFPSWSSVNEYVGDIRGVRPAYYMFYRESVETNDGSRQSTKFQIKDRVVTTNNLNVRSEPGTGSQIITTEAAGETGMITAGPTYQEDYWWWQVSFDDGFSGWSAENWLDSAPEYEEPADDEQAYEEPSYQGPRSLGERVVTTNNLNVRSEPGTGSQIITTEAAGETGMITAGPTYQEDYWWWQVSFDDGFSGWSAENWLDSAPEYEEPADDEQAYEEPSYQGPRSLGERVVTTNNLNVRSEPGTGSQIITTEAAGETGMITTGPTYQEDYWWWQVSFDDGFSGWSAENWLDSAPEYEEQEPAYEEPSYEEEEDEGLAYSKFVIGERVRVTSGLNVRTNPGTSGSKISTMAAGSTGTVLEGPISADGYTWWRISYADGTTGWSADDWLESA